MKQQLIKKEVYRHMILAKPHVFEITGKNPATPKIKWGETPQLNPAGEGSRRPSVAYPLRTNFDLY